MDWLLFIRSPRIAGPRNLDRLTQSVVDYFPVGSGIWHSPSGKIRGQAIWSAGRLSGIQAKDCAIDTLYLVIVYFVFLVWMHCATLKVLSSPSSCMF